MRTEEKRGRDEEGRDEGREGGKRGGYSQIEITYIYLPPACLPPSLFLSPSSPARRCVHY